MKYGYARVSTNEPVAKLEQRNAQGAEIKVNLNAEYFRWRQKQEKKKADG